MTVTIWRIAVEAPGWSADDLSGASAQRSGGRWNSAGKAALYCTSSIALAALETLAHLRGNALPFNRYLVKVSVPKAVWKRREVLAPLPGGWDAEPAGMSSRRAGDNWLAGRSASILVVPSAIVPDEDNFLVNPDHADAGKVLASTTKRWIYDPRFF
ncbi:RES family NAD+ phosphorylase [Actimicrobium sp. CCI2.3]|uniref:RES family NAD+ phosphorylase n=1 Tax=Actimicrobium sp. CCI2.3 TaxID=3048616 RepID=UPI002AB54148|nr:RES family NAD+ phosphorylase [Actimicrobium sp. CCI2.3]MDY7575690.1 RES family NAD+ phosphorylase [Actimicrobium sp. CCI2.3]MEB0021939.1 RES family NAD+ phosphorylase [Actimicrobium sp. CCI2.3]